MENVQKNINIFKWYYFFWRFKPLATLAVVYYIGVADSYTAAMGVLAFFSIIYAAAKIPSGIISDNFGRRKTILFAHFFMLSAFLLQALAGQWHLTVLLYVFAILFGVSEALLSGTTDALMYETAEEMKKNGDFKTIYSGSMFFDQFGCALGALAAMFVTYNISLQALAWISIIPVFVQSVIAFLFVEPNIKIKRQHPTVNDFKTVLYAFVINKRLRYFSVADVFFSTLGDVSHRFESAYFKTFSTEWIMSLARVFKHCFGMLGFAIVPKIKKYSMCKIYFGSIVLNLIVRSVAVILNNAVVPFVHMFINFGYATASTAKTDILQKEFMPQYRATTNSLVLFVKAIFMSLTTCVLGIIADKFNIYTAMIFLVLLRILGLLTAHLSRGKVK